MTDSNKHDAPATASDEGSASADKNTATQTPPAEKRAPDREKADQLPQWHVVLHNDEINTMDHVVASIVRITPLRQPLAIDRMQQAHHKGRARLLTTHRERAELYRDQFKARQLKVTLEPASA
jgi:ATP-dependent Clp protease adaptor protein ClpS